MKPQVLAPLVERATPKPVARTTSELDPSAEAPRTATMPEPILDLSYDIAEDKHKILEQLENTLTFERHNPRVQRSPSSWSAGGVTFWFEPPTFPNLRLCNLYFVPFSTTTGEPPEDISRHLLRVQHPAFDDWNSLRFTVGDAPEPPKTYRAAAVIQVPKKITTFKFSMEDKSGWQQSKDGLNLNVLRFEKDVVDLQVLDAKKTVIVVRNKAGSRLRPHYPMAFGGNGADHIVKYYGIVHSAEIYAVPKFQRAEKRFTFNLAELSMSNTPTVGLRTRGEKPAIAIEDEFRSLDEETLAAIKPVWFGDHESPEKPRGFSLVVPPDLAAPSNKLHLEPEAKMALIGEDGLLPVPNRSIKWKQQNDRIVFEVPASRSTRLVGISGEISIRGPSDFQVVRLQHPGHTNKFTQSVDELGIQVTAQFDRNFFRPMCLRGFYPTNAISIRVLDKDGVQLKQGGRFRKTEFYWGIPDRAELLFARTQVERAVPVEFLFDPEKKEVFEQGKSDASSLREMRRIFLDVSTGSRIAPAPKGHYATGIADAHYVYLREDSRRPMNYLSKDIAHADRTGAKRFGYEVKPYKGYTFAVVNKTVLPDGTVKGPEPQGEFTRHWAKGSFKTPYFVDDLRFCPDLVAYPEDPSGITIIYTMKFGEILYKHLGGEKPDALPSHLTKSGWKFLK